MHLENSRILITGTRSGLGKYLSEMFPNSVNLNRENKNTVLQQLQSIDYVIHCAFNTSREIEDYYQFLDDNIFLTKFLSELSPEKFIYISSVDVYSSEKTYYNMFKLFAESIVRKKCENHLILRCSALIGKNMRKNNFLRIVDDAVPRLSLTSNSTYNFVSHSDVYSVICGSITDDVKGTYDMVSAKNITIADLSSMFNKQSEFGGFYYETPTVDNQELIRVFDFMNKTSKEVVEDFIREKNEL